MICVNTSKTDAYKEAVHSFCSVYLPANKKYDLRAHIRFSSREGFIKIYKGELKSKNLVAKVTNMDETEAYREATDAINSWVKMYG